MNNRNLVHLLYLLSIISEIEIVPRSIDGSMDGILMKCSVALITEVDVSKGL